jgi:AraC family transcriptional regulator
MDAFRRTSAGQVFVPPTEWVQLARPSQWRGMRVAHYQTGPSEVEYCLSSQICLTLNKTAGMKAECKDSSGRWRTLLSHPGSISFTPWKFAGAARWQGSCEAINIYFDVGWLDGIDPDYASGVPSIDAPSYGVADKVVGRLIDDVYHDNLHGSPFGLMYAEALALAALHRLAALTTRYSAPRPLRAEGIIKRAVEFIHANLQMPLSVRDVAAAAGFYGNLYSFTRTFKRHCGRAPHQYILNARLEKARDLILRGNENMTEVALSCGFYSLSHFSVAFKNRWGIPPSALR